MEIFVDKRKLLLLIIFKQHKGLMGSKPTRPKSKPIFQVSEFQQIEPNQCNYRSFYGTYTSYQSKITHQQVDKYQLQFNTKNQKQNYYQCFLQRFREDYIVNTIQFIDISNRQLCSSLYRAQVFIQHIPIRLSDITDIPYPDSIYIIQNSLLGFQILYSMIGFFQVQEDHICINSYGEVKVWLNSNLSKNYPEDYHQQLKSQCDMVHKIINLIESNTNINQCPTQITQYFQKKYNKFPNFNQALLLLNQYTVEYKIIIPKYCQSVFQVFQESDSSKLKKQLKFHSQFTQSQSSYQKKSSRRDTIQVNDILIPRLDLPDPEILDENNNLQIPTTKSKTMRDTVKIYPSQNFYSINKLQSKYLFQKTERLFSPNRTFANKNPNYMTSYYNQLSTKRSPMLINSRESIYLNSNLNPTLIIGPPFGSLQSMKRSMAHTLFHGSQSTRYQNRPNVKFTYKSPLILRQNKLQFDPRFMIRQKLPKHKDQNLMQISKNVWQKYLNHSNLQDRNNNKIQEIKKQRVEKKSVSPLQNNIFNGKNKLININQLKFKTKSKQSKEKQKQKLSVFYYDTGQGSQLIDPQIAADLLKYL